MSKFNKTSTPVRSNTVNMAGGASYEFTDSKKELASVILSSILNGDKFYETDQSRINRVFDLVENLDDKIFAAKAMVYARHEANLRSITHILANALVENKVENLRSAIRRAVNRPDDMTEMAALWFNRHSGKMLPNSMRRAFRDLLESNKWDAFQIKRYSGAGKGVKLRDLVLLTHPRDTRGLFKGLIEGTIEAPKTLESKLASGQSAAASFEEMLDQNRLGYMAAVKNIRNALVSGISDTALDMWFKFITDPKQVRKSRMLPFRFIDAWEAVKNLNIDHFKLAKVKKAFNEAMIHSAHNLELTSGNEKIAIILDESGSMAGEFKLGLAMAAVLYTALPKDQVVVYFFTDDCRKVEFGNLGPLDIMEQFNRPRSRGTLFNAPFELLTKTRTKVDKIIIFTDMQLYSGGDHYYSRWNAIDYEDFNRYFTTYKSYTGSKPQLLFWDLRGYGGSTPVELKNDILIASGFSDKLLAIIPKLWRDQNALIKEIEAIEL
jgi:hypothetical protein